MVALGLIGGGIAVFASGSGSSSSSGGYTLTAPATILDGKYSKANAETNNTSNGTSDSGIKNGKGYTAQYKATNAQISIGGGYGDVYDPAAAMTAMLKALSTSGGGSATDQHPSGFDGDSMKCGTVGSGDVAMPYCAWADDSTIAFVAYANTDITGTVSNPSVSEWAETTAKIRNEIRVTK